MEPFEKIEYARMIVSPDECGCGKYHSETSEWEIFPWVPEFQGLPDITKPPPKISGHKTVWIKRTISYSSWESVED